MADVPEAMLARVKVGQGCQARSFGVPNQVFTGKVNSIAPVLSKERRSLRVLFTINDPDDQLRPGMFAEIGLGTDPRDALLMPTDGVIHIGRADYALVAAGEGRWRGVEVKVGEPLGNEVEILDGLQRWRQVLGKGAILLKPALVKLAGADSGPRAPPRRASMIGTLIQTALGYRWVVLLLAVAVMAAGVYSFQQQPIDAYPDISGQMVQIITVFPGRAPEEVEQQVTIPIEIAMGNVPRVEVIRSRTIFGLSVVQMMLRGRRRKLLGPAAGAGTAGRPCSCPTEPTPSSVRWPRPMAKSIATNCAPTAART